MSYVLLAFLIINTAVLSWGIYIIYSYDQRVTAVIEDAIRKQIMMQDDRIQKRLSRMEGQATDEEPTAVGHGIIGQPYKRP